MELHVDRIASDNESTLGKLYIDGVFECFTLEDQYREGPKVAKETRIPAGRYHIRLRTEGGKNQDYLKKYGPTKHQGMLHLQDVPGFEYILIHCGNTDTDSEGCLLVGDNHQIDTGHHTLVSSRAAYERLYPKVLTALTSGTPVEILISDCDLADRNRLAPEGKPRSGLAAAGAAVGGGAVIAAGAVDALGLGDKKEAPAASPSVVASPATVGTPEGGVPVPQPSASVAAPAPTGATVGGVQLSWVTIGIGAVIVVLALYLLFRRWREWKRRTQSRTL